MLKCVRVEVIGSEDPLFEFNLPKNLKEFLKNFITENFTHLFWLQLRPSSNNGGVHK